MFSQGALKNTEAFFYKTIIISQVWECYVNVKVAFYVENSFKRNRLFLNLFNISLSTKAYIINIGLYLSYKSKVELYNVS